jgi:hypothetical protein
LIEFIWQNPTDGEFVDTTALEEQEAEQMYGQQSNMAAQLAAEEAEAEAMFGH